jgi:hypothetical protein
MTTEHAAGPAPAKKRRLSKRVIRVWAWAAGVASFAAPWVVLGASPRPEVASTAALPTQQVIIRKVIRHVQARAAPAAAPKVTYVYQPAQPAPAKTSGSHP